MLLAIAVQRQIHVFQLDVETAFLYGDIDATVHVTQVAGFEVPGKEGWVWRLNKSLYGTKQAPRCWKSNLLATLSTLGLMPLLGDESLFVNDSCSVMLQIHVDNGLLERPSQHLGYTLDWQPDGSVVLHQSDFCLKTLRELGMDSANSVKEPAPLNLHHLISSDSLSRL